MLPTTNDQWPKTMLVCAMLDMLADIQRSFHTWLPPDLTNFNLVHPY